ncbi:ATP-binding cassette domain-containing protein [Candidatus Bathyarchaeota archaeon]|nr:ATP-binding cassette domain-containing protein [Candidatus Bathyarchaeota archaeon]MBS7628140.1 ATP-binding cassette domain-containing protein [Candidatus Bathyarchaeota archaeon]
MNKNTIVEIKNLRYKYPNSSEWVLKNINLRIMRGEFLCIAGPSGCGKSTLLYSLNGIVPHATGGLVEGKVIVDSLDTRKHSIYELSKIVALVQQNPENQMRTFSVRDELAFGPENLLLPRSEILDRITWAAKMVDIEPLLDREIRELSGGQKQRVAIAAALSMKPEVLVLDEPTSNIDPGSSIEIAKNLKAMHSKTGITIILAEHKLDLFLPMANRLCIMKEGEIVCDGDPRSVLIRYRDLLLEIGVRPPEISELFLNLTRAGYRCPPNLPLSLEEALESFKGNSGRPFKCICSPSRDIRSSEGGPIVEVENLSYVYPGGFKALDGINLQVRAGEFVGIIGNNGSGKTTFLLHLIGILKPQKGKVLIFGMDTRTTPISTIARRVGIVFQYPSQQLFENSVRDEMLFAPRNFGISEETVAKRFHDLLKEVDLEGLDERHPHSLSVGQMKRLNLASILIYDPDLIIMDEPFLGQDYGHIRKVMGILSELNRRGKTIFIVSHHITELAEYASRLLLFEGGRIIEDGPTREVLGRLSDSEERHPFCTPLCRLSRILFGKKIEEAPITVDEMFLALSGEGH